MTKRVLSALLIAFLACNSVCLWANSEANSKKKKSKNADIEAVSQKMHGVWVMEGTKTEKEKVFKPMEGFMKVFLEDGSFTNFQVAKGGATTSLSGRFTILSNETYMESFDYRINDQLEGNENELKFRFDGPNKLHLFWKLNVDDGSNKGEILVEEIWVKVTAPKVDKSKKRKKN